jgi:transposase-like protein
VYLLTIPLYTAGRSKCFRFWPPFFANASVRGGKSWRKDETYIKVSAQWKFLNRAVDRADDTVDFLPTGKRDKAVADALSLLATSVMAWNTSQVQAVLDRWSNRARSFHRN